MPSLERLRLDPRASFMLQFSIQGSSRREREYEISLSLFIGGSGTKKMVYKAIG